MTVANNYVPVKYTGNGVTTEFTVDWRLESGDDFVIYQNIDGVQSVVDPDDYTAFVKGEYYTDPENPGTLIQRAYSGIIFDTAPASGTIIVITRETPQEQDTPYKTSSGFPADRLEDDFDELTMMVQELQQESDRSIKTNITTNVDPETLVTEVERIYSSIDNVDAVADNASNINAVAGNATNINAVAGNATNINAVSADLSNIDSVANDLTQINAVNANKNNINSVAASLTEINTVYDNLYEIYTVANASNLAAITAVSSNATNINKVAAIDSDVSTVAYYINAVTSVANIASDITTVAADLDIISNVNDNLSDIGNVSMNMSNISTVSANTGYIYTVAFFIDAVTSVANNLQNIIDVNSNAININAVADNSTNINIVANNASNINTVINNMTAIINAPTYAQLAQNWANKITGTVDGVEYSAKYYAEQAAQSAASIVPTYRGDFDSAVQYYKGDIVSWNDYFFQAIQNNIGQTYPNNVYYWSEISNTNRVNYYVKSDNVEYPLAMLPSDVTGNSMAGPNYFPQSNKPTINASTGILTANAGIVTATQTQGDNSTKAATTAYVDTGLSGKQNTLISGTNIKTINNESLLGSGDITTIPSNMVTTDTEQDITKVKTFVGEKRIKFKQYLQFDRLGFTLYNNRNVEVGAFEYNASTTVNNKPIMTLNNYVTGTTHNTYVGFRYSGPAGAYNLLAPLGSDARSVFNLTSTATNFYLPLGFTDGVTTVTTDSTGVLNVSSLLPTVNNATLTITQGGVSKGTFTANASSDVTIALDAGGGSSLPSQTGNSGKFLTTDGTDPSWADVNYNNLTNKPDLSVYALDNAVVHLAGAETITGEKTFSATTYGTASDVNGSIVTTVNKSKAYNGYFQLGNGLIINWGKTSAISVDSNSVETADISFSKPYTTVVQVVTTTNNNTTNSNYGSVNSGVSAATTTGFKLAIANKSSGTTSSGAFWIAIGY